MPTSPAVARYLYVYTKHKYNRQLVQTKDKSEVGIRKKQGYEQSNVLLFHIE